MGIKRGVKTQMHCAASVPSAREFHFFFEDRDDLHKTAESFFGTASIRVTIESE